MKKSLKLTVVALATTILLSSCIGPFRLTNNILSWNEGVGDKFINELVFLGLHIVPVYPIAVFVDAVVLNSIEFWTGQSAIAEAGQTTTIKNAQGQDVLVTTTENGYVLSNGETDLNLVFDQKDRTWSAECNNQTTKLIQLNDNNTANLFVGEEVVEVSLDAEGINKALLHATCNLASNN